MNTTDISYQTMVSLVDQVGDVVDDKTAAIVDQIQQLVNMNTPLCLGDGRFAYTCIKSRFWFPRLASMLINNEVIHKAERIDFVVWFARNPSFGDDEMVALINIIHRHVPAYKFGAWLIPGSCFIGSPYVITHMLKHSGGHLVVDMNWNNVDIPSVTPEQASIAFLALVRNNYIKSIVPQHFNLKK